MAFLGDKLINSLAKSSKYFLQLKELEKKYKELEENISVGQQIIEHGSWTHDLLEDEIFLSDQVYQILGCNQKEFNGALESLYRFVHPEDLEKVKKATQGALSGIEYDIKYRIVTPDGVEKFVHEKTRAIVDEKKRPIKMVGIIQDITEQKRSENVLKEIGENLSQAQRVAGVGSWKYDVIKDKFYGSDEMYKIYGIEQDAHQRDFRNTMKLIHPEDQSKIQDALKKHLAGEACSVEYRIPQKDGTVKYVIGKGEPIFGENHCVVGVLGTIQDVTKNRLLEQELRQNHKIMAQTQALAQVGSWEMDIINNRNYWSEETYRIYGITPEQYEGTYEAFLKLVHPDDRKNIQNSLGNPSKKPVIIEFRIIKPDGSVRTVSELMEYVFDQDGFPILVYGTVQDITEKKEMERAIAQKQAEIDRIQKQFEILIQESSDAFGIITADGIIKYISQASERVIGYKPEACIGKKVHEFFEGAELERVAGMMDFLLQEPRREMKGDMCFRLKDGTVHHLDVYAKNLVFEPAVGGIAVTFRDITARVEMEQRLDFISTHDELTGLPSRLYFKRQLKLQCEYAEKKGVSFAAIILDISGLIYINNALGYEVGDKLLLQISQRLEKLLDSAKFVVCRFSGDQFGIIVKESNTIKGYEKIAGHISDLFMETFTVGIYELDVTMSMGISIFPGDAQEAGLLVKYATNALFWAKSAGKNQYRFYSSELNIQNYIKFELRNDLRRAIEKDQFRVFYQPMIHLQTNEILAAEALIRWEHPIWGLVSPNEFIPIAEETGFIINIGKWLLKEVCRKYKEWLSKGLPDIKVSVNYSSLQFFENNFVDNIINTINAFGLDPHFLIMEITESILLVNAERAISIINRLQSFGIQVALDDFGTGFSSLAYLHSFHINILKLDGSFIKNIHLDEAGTIIARSIIRMAQELKIKLVAEGIENWEQLSFLKELKCFAGQGYLYSRPIPIIEFEKVLMKKTCKPVMVNTMTSKPYTDRRKYFRVKFNQLLEADMTILKIKKEKVNVGNTKVLIKNIGPGGLCFVSNIKLPAEREFLLQFTTRLMGKELKVCGCPVWSEEMDDILHEYGIEFQIDENDRSNLIKELTQLQIRMRNNILFSDGTFTPYSAFNYFKNMVDK